MHILIIRFSAMGDVAMTVPVIKNLLNTYPELRVTMVSNSFFKPIFSNIDRCSFIGASLKDEHKGVVGLFKLSNKIRAQAGNINAIADLHNVLRSKIVKTFLGLGQIKSATIDKGRAQKKALTRKENKIMRQLKTSHERYADVFRKLGFPFEMKKEGSYLPRVKVNDLEFDFLQPHKKLIGIAPFAQHAEKTFPEEKMKEVLQNLSKQDEYQLLMFGGGASETERLHQWKNHFPSIEIVAGKFSLKDELKLISNLTCMVSMDSGNMHLASLFGIPVVSIWGATHPFAGFLGWSQSLETVVQADLFCRPCSVFGNKPCYRNNLECMKLNKSTSVVALVKDLAE